MGFIFFFLFFYGKLWKGEREGVGNWEQDIGALRTKGGPEAPKR